MAKSCQIPICWLFGDTLGDSWSSNMVLKQSITSKPLGLFTSTMYSDHIFDPFSYNQRFVPLGFWNSPGLFVAFSTEGERALSRCASVNYGLRWGFDDDRGKPLGSHFGLLARAEPRSCLKYTWKFFKNGMRECQFYIWFVGVLEVSLRLGHFCRTVLGTGCHWAGRSQGTSFLGQEFGWALSKELYKPPNLMNSQRWGKRPPTRLGLGSSHSKIVVEFLVLPTSGQRFFIWGQIEVGGFPLRFWVEFVSQDGSSDDLALRNSPDEYIYSRMEGKKMDTSHVLDGVPESFNVLKDISPGSPRPTPKRARGSEFGCKEGSWYEDGVCLSWNFVKY